LPLSRTIGWHGGSQLFEPAPPKYSSIVPSLTEEDCDGMRTHHM
jgi:hypothetical protein